MEGVSSAHSNIYNGVRQSTARAFLTGPKKTRPNLTVLPFAYVTRILFQGKTAIGVQLKRGSSDFKVLQKKKNELVFAKKEVIITGGAINSPWLLMLSGIGPADQLRAFDIPIVADLPVGKNLQDHLFVFHSFEVKDQKSFPIHKGLGTIKHLLQVFLFFFFFF